MFCDSYGPEWVPVVTAAAAAPRIVLATAGSGAGYRLGPAIARQALDRVTSGGRIMMNVSERWVDVPGGRVRVRIVGDGPGIPLIVLHGGPGSTHIYLENRWRRWAPSGR